MMTTQMHQEPLHSKSDALRRAGQPLVQVKTLNPHQIFAQINVRLEYNIADGEENKTDQELTLYLCPLAPVHSSSALA